MTAAPSALVPPARPHDCACGRRAYSTHDGLYLCILAFQVAKGRLCVVRCDAAQADRRLATYPCIKENA